MRYYSLPTSGQLQTYLRFKRWEEMPPGPVGSLWAKAEARVGVPHDDQLDLLEGAIERVAQVERKKPNEIAMEARYLLYDVTLLRAVSDGRLADTIPLETASTIVASARTMLRATATTARSERAHIRSYSKLGDEVIKQTLMGHTERGSFVIPILIPLPEPQATESDQLIDLYPTLPGPDFDGCSSFRGT